MNETEPAQPAKTRPRRALRIVVWTLLGLLLILLAAGAYLYRSAGTVPDWYEPMASDTPLVLEHARRAENKISEVQEWAGAKHAYESAKQYGTPLAPRPADELVISFTQGEVNSFLGKWYGRFGSDQIDGKRLSDVFRGPMVRIEKDHISFAGAVPPLKGRVVSLDLEPRVVDGNLKLHIRAIRSGNLALPEFTWARPKQMLIESLQNIALKLAPMSRVDAAGAANVEAVSATMARQGIDSLMEQATDNVLFLPVLSIQGGLPVKLKSCELAEGVITLTTEPLTAQEREKLIYKIRGGKEPDKVPVYLKPSTRSTR